MPNSQVCPRLPLCLQPDRDEEWCEPLDARDLATRLEAEGVTDAVAAADFHFDSTRSMAEAWLWKVASGKPPAAPAKHFRRRWREYWDGISFALPLLCSCISILVLEFSLWGGNLTAEDATAVGLGLVGSFLLCGGFVQVMARRGLFFAGTKQFRRCEQSTWAGVRAASAGLLLSTCVLLAASAYWDWLSTRHNLIAGGFCVALGLFWLATGILHVLHRFLDVTWITLAGITLVAALYRGLGWPLLVSQILTICLSAGVALAISARVLRRNREQTPVPVPPGSLLRDVFFLWPYFAYGVLYYGLLFADRLVAWTAHTQSSALAVQFRGDYEIALNFGLLAFVFQVGWVHRSTAVFYREVARLERRVSIDCVAGFSRAMIGFYWGRIAGFVPLAIAAAALSLGVAAAGSFLRGSAVAITAFWSLAGFPFLVVGLWNVSLLFGLSRASKAAAAAAAACVVDVVAGYLLSRLGSYHYAVAGFTLGALVFALVSGFWTLRAFRRLDYYYFAASA